MIKFEVGQILEVYDNTCDHMFDIGEKVRVRALNEDGDIDSCEHLDGSDYWFVDSFDVRHIDGDVK